MIMIAFMAIMEALLSFPKTYSQLLVFQNLIDSHTKIQYAFLNGAICHQEQELQVSKRISLQTNRDGR